MTLAHWYPECPLAVTINISAFLWLSILAGQWPSLEQSWHNETKAVQHDTRKRKAKLSVSSISIFLSTSRNKSALKNYLLINLLWTTYNNVLTVICHIRFPGERNLTLTNRGHLSPLRFHLELGWSPNSYGVTIGLWEGNTEWSFPTSWSQDQVRTLCLHIELWLYHLRGNKTRESRYT